MTVSSLRAKGSRLRKDRQLQALTLRPDELPPADQEAAALPRVSTAGSIVTATRPLVVASGGSGKTSQLRRIDAARSPASSAI